MVSVNKSPYMIHTGNHVTSRSNLFYNYLHIILLIGLDIQEHLWCFTWPHIVLFRLTILLWSGYSNANPLSPLVPGGGGRACAYLLESFGLLLLCTLLYRTAVNWTCFYLREVSFNSLQLKIPYVVNTNNLRSIARCILNPFVAVVLTCHSSFQGWTDKCFILERKGCHLCL